jgi:succinate dehydrogenase hydrophobic anchor subunit
MPGLQVSGDLRVASWFSQLVAAAESFIDRWVMDLACNCHGGLGMWLILNDLHRGWTLDVSGARALYAVRLVAE